MRLPLGEFWKLAVGCVDQPPPVPFATLEEWLAHEDEDDGLGGLAVRSPGVAPHLCLLEVLEPKTAKNRPHHDLVASGEGPPETKWRRVTDEVARLRAAGASLLAEFTGHHVVVADPEGNEFCVT